MEFRRFGGSFTGKDSGSDINIAIIGVYLLVICCGVAIITALARFVVLGFGLMFLFMVIGMFHRGGSVTQVFSRRKRDSG